MKKFLNSAFCIGLLLCAPGTILKASSDHCNSGKSNDCFSKFSKECKSSCNSEKSNSCEESNSCEKYSCSNSCSDSCSSSCSYYSDSSCNHSCESNSHSNDCANCTNAPVRTYLHIRSQGANTAREIVGWQWDLNLPFMCNNYGAAYIAYEYQRSFDSRHISNVYFGGPILRFSGSLVPDRDARNELLADNFGLSRTFKGYLTFKPSIQNHIVDLGYYLGLDCWLQGSYVRIQAPIVYSFWTLNPCEHIEEIGSATESACYFGSDDVAISAVPVYATAVPTVKVATSLRQALSGTFLFGDMQTPWRAGRFDFHGRGRTALADIDIILGYNFINTDCYHFGAYLQMVLNTPPKPKDFFVFDPVVGNGSQFELGAGISAHWVFWSNENQNLALFLEGNITHMFTNEQCRLFDLCNGPFSRYMLLKEYDTNGIENFYNGHLINAVNFANRKVKVKVDIKGDLAIKLAYRWCGWGMDLGYNIYGHSHETIHTRCDDSSDCAPRRILSPKGTSGVCCFNYPVVCVPNASGLYVKEIFPDKATLPAGASQCDSTTNSCPTVPVPYTSEYRVTAVVNNGSQPNATAYAGYPVINPNPTTGTDLSCTVSLSSSNTAVVPATGQAVSSLVSDGFILCDNVPLTKPLTVHDLNKTSAESVSQMTHKFFGFFNYQWYDKNGWNPQMGFGAECEFNKRRISAICKRGDLEQWGVWFKGSLAF